MEQLMEILTAHSWSPYAVGVGIGVLAWLSFLISDKPLGVSTAFSKAAGLIERGVAGARVEQKPYYQKNPLDIDWKWMFVCGLFLGALVSARLSGPLNWQWVPPMWEAQFGPGVGLRLGLSLLGGVAIGFGARWGRGCTSGHAISGTLQLVLSSWLAATCFFVGGIIVAFGLYA